MRFKVTIEAVVEFGKGRPSHDDYMAAAQRVVDAVEQRHKNATIKVTEKGGLGGSTVETDASQLPFTVVR